MTWPSGLRAASRTKGDHTKLRPLIALLSAAVVLVAGCGSDGPHMQRSVAAPLIALADRISREGACAQARDIRALNTRLVSLVNARRVPPSLQESLSSGVNALVVQTPPCLPAVPADTTPPVTLTRPGHGKHKGQKKHGDGGGD